MACHLPGLGLDVINACKSHQCEVAVLYVVIELLVPFRVGFGPPHVGHVVKDKAVAGEHGASGVPLLDLYCINCSQ